MKWLYKLDYKYGNKYIRNLMTVIVAGMVIVYLADLFTAPAGIAISSFLSLNIAEILRGQVWRLVTFVFVYPNSSAFFLLFSLYFYFMMGRLLENYWGGFKLNIYYLCGILGAILGAFACYFLAPVLGLNLLTVTGSNSYLNLSLFLAFAAIAPDTEFRLFFILPIKAKWMMIAYAVMLLIPLLQTFLFGSFALGLLQLIQLAFSLINFFIFFGPSLVESIRNSIRMRRNRRNWKNNNNRWN